jgi:adenylate cyclase
MDTTTRILVVDDSADMRNCLTESLKVANPSWVCLTAADVAEGARILEEQRAKGERVAVVLTDLEFREGADGTSGMEMVRRARQIEPWVMVILYSHYEELLDRYAALECGAFDVIECNMRGSAFAQEINVKTRAALKYRELETRLHYLSRYFDQKLFEMLQRDPSLLEMRERYVTVSFWDIQGFSRLTKQLAGKPRLVSGFLREYSQAAVETIFHHGGVVDKFMGDGILGLFGVFDPPDDEAAQQRAAHGAIEAACVIRVEFDRLLAKWRRKWEDAEADFMDIGLRCGINSGYALVGNAGTEVRDQFTALGNCVNLASRLEKAADGVRRQILLSRTTRNKVADLVRVTELPPLTGVKGIEGTFAIYAVA